MPILGSPDAFVSFVSHEDAASAVVAALRVPAGIYNVADDPPLRRRGFAETIAGMLGQRSPKFLPRWAVKLAGPSCATMARSVRISNPELRHSCRCASRG